LTLKRFTIPAYAGMTERTACRFGRTYYQCSQVRTTASWHREAEADCGVAVVKQPHQKAKWRSETAHFAQTSHNRAAAKRGQAALNF
jgi:hypothetical protein